MNDKEIGELLHDFVRGRLSRKQAHEVEARLSASDSLRKELEQVRAYYGALDNMEPVRPSDDFLDKVHERIAAVPERAGFMQKLFFPLHLKVPLELAGVAATFVVLVFLYAPYIGQKPMPQQTIPAEPQPLSRVEPVVSSEELTAKPMENKQALLSEKKMAHPKRGSFRAKASAASLPAARKTAPAVPAPGPQVAMTGTSAVVELDNAAVPAAPAAAPEFAMSRYEQVPAAAEKKRAASDRHMSAAAAGAAPASVIAAEEMGVEKPHQPEPMTQKLSEQNEKANSTASVKPEIVVQWWYASMAPSGSAAAEMSEQAQSRVENEEASRRVPARAKKSQDAYGETGEDAFIAALLDRYKATAKTSRVADVTIRRIDIAAGYLAPFLEQLRAHGKTVVSGEVPPARSSENVTIILRTEQEQR